MYGTRWNCLLRKVRSYRRRRVSGVLPPLLRGFLVDGEGENTGETSRNMEVLRQERVDGSGEERRGETTKGGAGLECYRVKKYQMAHNRASIPALSY